MTSAHRDEAVQRAVLICELIAVFFAALVIVGVGAEAILPILGLYPAPSTWPAVFVAVGVAVETIFGFRGSHLQGALTARSNDRLADATQLAGEANERAAKAELETARIRTSLVERRLTSAQKEALIAGLTGSGITVSVIAVGSDREAATFAEDFISTLKEAGVLEGVIRGGSIRVNGLDPIPPGTNVTGRPDALALFKSALTRASVEFVSDGPVALGIRTKSMLLLTIGARPYLAA